VQLAWYQIDDNLEELFYAIEGIISCATLTNMFQYGIWRCMSRRGNLSHWERWDGAYIIGISLPLNLTYPIAVVFVYIGKLGLPESGMWHSGSWFPNRAHGIFLFVMKWIGFLILTYGMFNVTQLHVRIVAKWREIRMGGELAEVDLAVDSGPPDKYPVTMWKDGQPRTVHDDTT